MSSLSSHPALSNLWPSWKAVWMPSCTNARQWTWIWPWTSWWKCCPIWGSWPFGITIVGADFGSKCANWRQKRALNNARPPSWSHSRRFTLNCLQQTRNSKKLVYLCNQFTFLGAFTFTIPFQNILSFLESFTKFFTIFHFSSNILLTKSQYPCIRDKKPVSTNLFNPTDNLSY